VVGVQDSRVYSSRKQATEFCLPLDQSIPAEVSPVQRENIEGDEARFQPMEEKIVEPWISVFIEADDFAIENCRASDRRTDCGG